MTEQQTNTPHNDENAIVPHHKSDEEQSPSANNPGQALVKAIENSPVMRPFVERYTSQAIADSVLNLAVFAPMIPTEAKVIKERLSIDPQSLRFLENGTYIESTFDFGAFKGICTDTIDTPLTQEDSRLLFEALKDSPILERVYSHADLQPLLKTGQVIIMPNNNEENVVLNPVIWQDQENIVDTGRAALPPQIQSILEQYWDMVEGEE